MEHTSNADIKLFVKKANLTLRSAFGTSHSSTTTRSNAMITIQFNNFSGYGEVGLPPKKKHCYLADYDDIEHFFNQYHSHVQTELKKHQDFSQKSYKDWLSIDEEKIDQPFTNIEPFFSSLNVTDPNQELTFQQIFPFLLLKVLDTYQYFDKDQNLPEYRFAAKCGIEMAIFDLWSSILGKPLHDLIGIEPPSQKYSFYTAALNEDISEIEKNARFGLKYTHHLKIKLDQDIEKGITILDRLVSLYSKEGFLPCSWSVDANSAWSPDLSLSFLNSLKTKLPEFSKYLYMVEQPYPVEKIEITKLSNEWKNVKEQYEKEGIFLFADESISTAADIPVIKEYVHGVNIKLEKAGGIRGALEAILTAKKHGLKVWLGCMVSTRLSCTCSAQLLSLSEIGGDLDGDLLVDEESQPFAGGFKWGKEGLVVLPEAHGIGLKPK